MSFDLGRFATADTDPITAAAAPRGSRNYSARRSPRIPLPRLSSMSPCPRPPCLFSASEESRSLARSTRIHSHRSRREKEREKQREKRKEICAVDEMWTGGRRSSSSFSRIWIYPSKGVIPCWVQSHCMYITAVDCTERVFSSPFPVLPHHNSGF